MAIQFSDLQLKLDYFFDDPLPEDEEARRRFSLPVRINSWNWAQKFFVSHTPLQKTQVLTPGEDGRSAPLPSDFFAVEGIYDTEEEAWWQQIEFGPGSYRDSHGDSASYWMWGGDIRLEREITDNLILYYWAYYPEIEYEIGDSDEDITYTQETVYTPYWAEAALCYLTTGFCWHPGAVLAYDVNQWKIRVDSGTPMHNPRFAASIDAFWWYNELLGQVHPARG